MEVEGLLLRRRCYFSSTGPLIDLRSGMPRRHAPRAGEDRAASVVVVVDLVRRPSAHEHRQAQRVLPLDSW